MDAVDIYGLSEVMGPGVANECVETKDGLHIWEDHFYPEVIDPETGKPLPDGEQGELVFTSLTKEGLPVIRYRTRDLTRLLPGTARSHRRMEKVTGRSDDMMIVRGVNVFPTQIEELLLRCQGLSPHYLIELTREDRLDVCDAAGRGAAGDARQRRARRGGRVARRAYPQQYRHRHEGDGRRSRRGRALGRQGAPRRRQEAEKLMARPRSADHDIKRRAILRSLREHCSRRTAMTAPRWRRWPRPAACRRRCSIITMPARRRCCSTSCASICRN